MKRRVLVPILLAACLAHGTAAGGGSPSGDAVLLVIPARYTVVQFCFDIAGLRPVCLLAYEGTGETNPPVLYLWDKGRKAWNSVEPADYDTGGIFENPPQTVVLIGSEQDLPAQLREMPAWASTVVRVVSLQIVELANALDGVLDFKAREWKRIAKRYGLVLEDQNWERRRYGRYGPPGSPKEKPESVREAAPSEAETPLETAPAQPPAETPADK